MRNATPDKTVMLELAEAGYFERKIIGQLVDSGKLIRDGKRKITFSNVNFLKEKVIFQEYVDSIRTEYESIESQKGPVKILNRALKRSTRIEVSLAESGGLRFKSFRLGKEEETTTSQGYVLIENGVVFMVVHSRLSFDRKFKCERFFAVLKTNFSSRWNAHDRCCGFESARKS